MTAPPLVLTAHGSADPRFGATLDAVAARVGRLRPDLDVRIAYLEHGPPDLGEVVTPDAVVVPLLLSRGYHALVDIPAQAPGARVTRAAGPDRQLAVALADRLHEAGYDAADTAGAAGVVLAAAGSTDERALADVHVAAGHLADLLGVDVVAAFVSAGTPRIADLAPQVVASYLVAPGAFHDALGRCGAAVVSAPIGDHPAVTDVVLARYDEAVGQVPGRIAPA